ncbi:MFS transporter [Streptomyces sp. NPDC006530]|uniref:MFS transporter n=1 Tax=Streptomyces sp. NPDC006530 TaxID=3364750 RepID=UPI0036A818E6
MRTRYSLSIYLTGAVAARAGDEMSGPALMLAGFALSGSMTEASSLLASITISAAIGGPMLGTLLDRAGCPGRLLAAAMVMYAVGLMVILTGLGRLPLQVTLAVAVLTGLLGPALSGGWTAQLPGVASDDSLPRANVLDAMTFSVASLAGPALAGTVAQAMGARTSVIVSAMLIVLALPAAWLLPRRPGRVPGPRPTLLISDLAAGLRVIAAKPSLARATLTSVISCTAQGMLTACVPLLGARVLGGPGRGALLLSGVAISALMANAVLARFPRVITPDTIIWASALVQAAALALAASGRPVALIAAVLIAGLGEGPQLAALFAIRHRESPEHLRGQIFTTGASVKLSGFALGAAVAGPAMTWSLPGTLATASCMALLGALAFFAVPSPAPGDAAGDCEDLLCPEGSQAGGRDRFS